MRLCFRGQHSLSLTRLGVHVEERPVSFRHPVGQLPLGGRVGVRGLHLDDGPDRAQVLRDGREIHRLGELRGVVVDVQDVQEDVGPGGQRLRPQVGGVHGEPVVRPRLAVQRLRRADHT